MEMTENPGEGSPLTARRVAKCSPVNIEFQDLIYSVRDGHLKEGGRKLLKSVNGIFKSGELTAIMGPSGAGKSTLLNILAGYVSVGVQGTIKINDRHRDMKVFNKFSSYIMQDDIIQPRLTVKEAMMIAAHLKIGTKMNDREKEANVNEICKLLGLQKCYDTRSEYLSGGQRKRLAVALELVNNPPVIFLDEPTTGLDNYAIKQCMDLLNQISKEGRNVICTIHQPPTSLFQTFDKVYVLAQGYCVYNGSPKQLVPFLSMSQYDCPQTYTPAEYIIELVQSCPETITVLSGSIQNGKTCMMDRAETKAIRQLVEYPNEIYQETTHSIQDADVAFPLSGYAQFAILLRRMFLQMARNRTMIYIQFFHHLLSGLLIGLIFFGIGHKGSQTFSVFKYCISITVFFMYTHVMSPVLMFPLEVKLMRREYFNRWYSLKAYFMAMSLATIPLLIVLGMMFLTIVYFITDQPVEINRFAMFTAMGILLGLCSQGLGYTIGASCNILNGSIVGPSILAPLIAFTMYGMGYRANIEPVMKVLMAMSYVRHGVEGFCMSLFEGRGPLECEEEMIYCHYANPKMVMLDMGMADTTYSRGFFGVLIFMVVFRVMAYMALKYRLSSEFSVKIVNYAAKIMQRE